MIATWIVLMIGVGCAALVGMSAWRHRVDMAELGTVSTHWLAENRAQDREYSQR
jgi:hypothetical protein